MVEYGAASSTMGGGSASGIDEREDRGFIQRRARQHISPNACCSNVTTATSSGYAKKPVVVRRGGTGASTVL